MYSMVSNVLTSYLVSESGCNLLSLWPSPTSSLSEEINVPKGVETISIKQAFVGTSGTEAANCKEVGTKTTCKLSKVVGGLTFKGQVALP